ncbi:adenosylcobinamide-phosphate synthase CbiB [Niameybacter massiliensis]|uniref:Cobalamin biosynthesis protein CobD n=1 Tax=Holtiella tumoricola TaxID=3018743 RepID=A0AA42IZQ7_9FIRM|nr:adenosylcobinamide-phosphate synthase CbiB [Holtiella tumoricola]MDA3730624.1 adenosylcobinamide-phosphate synthase CbiB [Holtiella tumoricola]
MKSIILITVCAFILDLLLGDPYHFPHPVRAIGTLITKGEKWIRSWIPQTKKGERIGGTILVIAVVGITFFVSLTVITLAYWIHPVVGFILQVIMGYQVLATKSLKDESMKVYIALKKHDLEGARYAVSMIVGRDTASLDEQGVAKAAIETVAENTSDGIIGPLFYLVIGGVPLAYLYKAINTLDSMIGYKNDKYQYFGTFGAKLDDVANYIPARISAYLMILASGLCGMSIKGAYKIYKRDRYNHKSPNSAHTEAACAGALEIQLAGDAYYFGKKCEKPTIGDSIRPVETEDIKRTNQLMYATCILGLLVFIAIRAIVMR